MGREKGSGGGYIGQRQISGLILKSTLVTNIKKRVIVGTRTSPLSLAQTDTVLRELRLRFPATQIVTIPMSTGGDRNKKAPLLSMERGMFVKEIENALLSEEIDIAVHSAKDLPAILPDGLVLAAFSEREDPRDVLVTRSGTTLQQLPPGARIGTSSPRRQALIRSIRPDVSVIPVRGNVGTRIQKAKSDDYDGVILAAAGINRLGRQSEISEYFDPESFIPDTGQGALALEVREFDEAIIEMLSTINHNPTSVAVRAERAFLKTMGGGCKVPVAAHARFQDGKFHVAAMAAVPDGSEIFRHQMIVDSVDDPESVGRQAAEDLIAGGAGKIVSQEHEV